MWNPPELKPLPRPKPSKKESWEQGFEAARVDAPEVVPEDRHERWLWERKKHELRSSSDGTWTTAAGYVVVGPPIPPEALVFYPKDRWREHEWAKFHSLSDTNVVLRHMLGLGYRRPTSWSRIELGRTADRHFPELVRGIALSPFRGNWVHVRYFCRNEIIRALRKRRDMVGRMRAKENARIAKQEARAARKASIERRKALSALQSAEGR
jgi:hypothetical protein